MEFFTVGHLAVLAIVVGVLYFGGNKLPEMSRSLGKSLRVFKSEMKGLSDEVNGRHDEQDGSTTPVTAELEAPVPSAAPQQVAPQQAVRAPAAPGYARPAEVPLRKAEVIPNPAAPRTRPRPSPRPLDSSSIGGQ